MNKIIKKVLEKLENNGYEAYLIGGYVRDLLMGISAYDIDICTNATPRELLKIFPNGSAKNLGGIDFKIKEYHFEITTYRKELKYNKRKPVEFNYINNLVEDLQRRDFTINTICMNKKGEIIDLLNGLKDLKKQKIRMVGDIKSKINEDPLRILRGIRIATSLDFNIETNLYKAFKENHKDILKLSSTRIKEELDKILLSDNAKKGLKLLSDVGIARDLGISFNKDIVPVKNLEGMYAQIKVTYKLPYTKYEKNNIETISKILKDKDITLKTLYNYGLYMCSIATEILNINSKKVNKLYKNLPIHDRSDVNINIEDMIKKFGISGKEISKLIAEVEEAIITKKIKNKKNEIIKYITNYRKENT